MSQMAMDLSPEVLSVHLSGAISPHPERRRHAEHYLDELSCYPGLALSLLRLASLASADQHVRLTAAVSLKNHLRFRWGSVTAGPEREQIKTLLLAFLLDTSTTVPAPVRRQLLEALATIAPREFPGRWPALLPRLAAGLHGASLLSGEARWALAAANAIFKRFRYELKTDGLVLELRHYLHCFGAGVLAAFLDAAEVISSAAAASCPAEALVPLFDCQRLCCHIWYSLNCQDLLQFPEEHIWKWMFQFRRHLTSKYPAMEADSKGVRAVDGLRAAICKNIGLYINRYAEEFEPYLNDFTSAVLDLLIHLPIDPSRDKLAINATAFLIEVSTSRRHHSSLNSPEILKQVFDKIIIPNTQIRDEELELFESDYAEYTLRDMEGDDLDTKRRAACELAKGIARNYREQVAQMVSGRAERTMRLYESDPLANWKQKDCLIHLVVALAGRKAETGRNCENLVDVERFFSWAIAPELQCQDLNGHLLLKASALKFFTAFGGQIPKRVALTFIPDVVRLLGSASNVVHSYAAICIEKLLLVKDEGHPRYGAADIQPVLPTLLNNLFNALSFSGSQENQYIMKCMLRVFEVADIGVEGAAVCIANLGDTLSVVCKNPINPVFNRYLFEAVAGLVGKSCQKDPSVAPLLETCLSPVLEAILESDVSELSSYAFQIFAHIFEFSEPPLDPKYVQLFEMLLSLEAWQMPGLSRSAPSRVKLLQTYLQKAPNELNKQDRVSEVLGISYSLVSATRTEKLGFHLLNTVMESLSWEGIACHVCNIWIALFSRPEEQRNAEFVKSLITFMSLFMIKYGHRALVDSIGAVQDITFAAILEQYWIPNLNLVTGFIELKVTSIASTILLCESPCLLDDNSMTSMWGKLLDSIIALLSRLERENPAVVLQNAQKKEDDPLKEVEDPKEFLVTSLAKLSALSPGELPAVVKSSLQPTNLAILLQLCDSYNCSVV